MAKKKKYRKVPTSRARRPSTVPPQPGRGQATGTSPTASGETLPAQRSTRFATRSAAPRDWAYEYRYVIADLKRMGYTTVAMFALLFGLAIAVQFILR